MGEFLPREVANILWAYAAMDLSPSEGVLGPLCELATDIIGEAMRVRGDTGLVKMEQKLALQMMVSQMRLFLLSAELRGGERSNTAVAAMRDAIGAMWKDALSASPPQESRLQREVARTVKSLMSVWCEEEVVDVRTGYSIDLLVVPRDVIVGGKQGDGGSQVRGEVEAADLSPTLSRQNRKVAMEVDGPSHFLAGTREPKGATVMKRRILEALGYHVVSVPYWEWYQLRGDDDKMAYVRRLLDGIRP